MCESSLHHIVERESCGGVSWQDPIFAICARQEDEEVDVVDGGDSGGDDPGDNIFIGRQLIITASLVGS